MDDVLSVTEHGGVKIMRLRYAGACGCGTELPAGTRAGWDATAKRVVCAPCLDPEPLAVAAPSVIPEQSPAPVDVRPAAGASLQREYERRVAKREKNIRSAHPRIGGLILALTDEPASTRAFKIGAEGEREAAERLLGRCSPEVTLLLNRSLGRGRRDGDIDVLAITPTGVWIADVKNYRGKVEVRRSGGFRSPLREQLVIGGRDKTKLLDSVAKQLDAVRTALTDLDGADAVPLRTALVFVDADLPLLSTPTIGGVPCLGSKQAAKVFSNPGDLEAATRAQIRVHLEAKLPPAR